MVTWSVIEWAVPVLAVLRHYSGLGVLIEDLGHGVRQTCILTPISSLTTCVI